MAEPPVTRPSLLVRIRDTGDTDAWRLFVDLYAPMIYGFARRRGLQDADAADLTQDVFRTVAVRPPDYDPHRGTFRGWLYTVTRNKVRDFVERRGRIPTAGDTAALDEQPAREDDEMAQWDRDYEKRLFHWAAEQIRGEFAGPTWQAFWRVAVDGTAAAEVAAALGMSVGAVYVSKSRVVARLRKQIQQWQEE
jgi:RNA polymerase sigma factor (sigma-70 family)